MASDDEQDEEKKADGGKIKIPAHLMGAAATAPARKPAWMQKLAAAKAGGGAKTQQPAYQVKEASSSETPAAAADPEEDKKDEPDPELSPTRRRGYTIKSVATAPSPSAAEDPGGAKEAAKESESPAAPASTANATPNPGQGAMSVTSDEHSLQDPLKAMEEAQKNDAASVDPNNRSSQSRLSAKLHTLQRLKQNIQNMDSAAGSIEDKEKAPSANDSNKGLLDSLGNASQSDDVFEDSGGEDDVIEEVVTSDEDEEGWEATSSSTVEEEEEEEVIEEAEKAEPLSPDGGPTPPAVQKVFQNEVSSSPKNPAASVGEEESFAPPRPAAAASSLNPPVFSEDESFAPPRATGRPTEIPPAIPTKEETLAAPRPAAVASSFIPVEEESFAPPRPTGPPRVAPPQQTLVAPSEPSEKGPKISSTGILPRPPSNSTVMLPRPPSNSNLDTSLDEDDDWMIPRRNDDDSSWVNPSHPVQPERKQYLVEELKKKSVDLFPEDGQASQRLKNLKAIDEEAKFSDLEYDTKVGLIVEHHHRGDGQTISETSYSEFSSKMDSARIYETSVPSRDMDVWAVPSQDASYRAVGKLGEHKDGKDYRFSYIAQQHTHSTSSYADIVRERYFPKEDNEYWAAPAKETTPVLPLHITRNGTIQSGPSDENESWMPPEIDPNEMVVVDKAKIYAPSIAEEKYSGARSVATEGSDWMGRSGDSGSRVRRVDFAGNIDTENPEDSFEWNPTVELSPPPSEKSAPPNTGTVMSRIKRPKESLPGPPADDSASSSAADDEESEEDEASDEDEFATNRVEARPRPPSPPASHKKGPATERASLPAESAIAEKQYDYSPSGRLKFDMTPEMILIEDNVERGQAKSRRRSRGSKEDHNRFLCCMSSFFFLCLAPAAVACIVIFVVDPNNKRGNDDAITTPAPTSSPTSTKAPSTPTVSNPTAPSLPTAEDDLLDFLTGFSTDGGEALRDESSPQYAAMQWLLTSDNEGINDDEVLLQRFALATLYFSTEGSQWSLSTGWLTDEPECNWYTSSELSTICDTDGMIEELNLDNNNLVGSIPPELNLLSTSLVSLQLQRNKLEGQVPPVLSDLNNLRTLQLSQNELRGSIPSVLGLLPNLRTLFLYNNFFQSTIPTLLGKLSTLVEMDFGANELTGTIPTELGRLDELESLSLYDNKLSGTIPEELSRINTLRVLYLDSNDFGPSLPVDFCDRTSFDDFWTDCDEIGGCDCCTKCCQDGQPCA